MRRHVFLYVLLPSLSLCFALGPFAPAATATYGYYESAFTLHVDEGTSATRHSFAAGSVEASYTHGSDGTFTWDGLFEAEGDVVRAALYFRRNHRSSSDAFKLVHASARTDESVAAVLEWSGSLSGVFQYVNEAPVRGRVGSVLAVRVDPPVWSVGATFVAYGSDRARHQFVAVDGATRLASTVPIQWGAAVRTGFDVDDGQGPGHIVHMPVHDGAAFVRGEWTAGAHSGWLRVHATEPQFRSFVADTYPFARGKVGVEGRWRWRVAPNRLISVYGQRLQALPGAIVSDQDALPDVELEASYSFMPRSAWGWRVAADLNTTPYQWTLAAVEFTTTDAGRRFELVSTLSWRQERSSWRHRVQWDVGPWRVRLTVDEAFPGWRAEWRVTDYGSWSWIAVYKRRVTSGTDAFTDWMHAELSRSVARFGELWVRYMEPDLGRLDVGWKRPLTVSAGVRVTF